MSKNQINPAKLHNSKWTEVNPKRREKHFLVSDIKFDDDGAVLLCKVEAVLSRNEYAIDWRELQDPLTWRQGWQ
ncbi:MAG: TIGR02450 family Trp-rich protein [Flavobacteriaceae bacterium]|nr:TIGR02450 family Trp-rich protein [Flavobacteriaceae bacterium]